MAAARKNEFRRSYTHLSEPVYLQLCFYVNAVLSRNVDLCQIVLSHSTLVQSPKISMEQSSSSEAIRSSGLSRISALFMEPEGSKGSVQVRGLVKCFVTF
jgi:hypothetical protein